MLAIPLVVALLLAFLLVGVAVGYLYTKDSDATKTEKTRTIIAMAVTAIWIVAMVADIFITAYSMSPLVHAIMGAVVGYFFAEKGLDINIGGP